MSSVDQAVTYMPNHPTASCPPSSAGGPGCFLTSLLVTGPGFSSTSPLNSNIILVTAAAVVAEQAAQGSSSAAAAAVGVQVVQPSK